MAGCNGASVRVDGVLPRAKHFARHHVERHLTRSAIVRIVRDMGTPSEAWAEYEAQRSQSVAESRANALEKARAARAKKAAERAARPTHFRVAGEPANFKWPRVLCGKRRGLSWEITKELRATALVTCPTCLVVRDMWLENGGKPRMTIRRARIFLKSKGFPTP